MGAYWGFELHFAKVHDKGILKKRFLEAISPYVLYDKSEKSPSGVLGIWLKRPDSEYGGANYSLNVDDSRIVLITDMTIDATEMGLLDEVMLKVSQQLNPVVAVSCLEGALGTINELSAMYYSDPYYFALEPPGNYRPVIRQTLEQFLRDNKIKKKLAEIKKVLPLKELVEILRRYSEKVVLGQNGGIGILKGAAANGPNATYVFPHYFLRQVIRSRGIQLEGGFAEKYAKMLLT